MLNFLKRKNMEMYTKTLALAIILATSLNTKTLAENNSCDDLQIKFINTTNYFLNVDYSNNSHGKINSGNISIAPHSPIPIDLPTTINRNQTYIFTTMKITYTTSNMGPSSLLSPDILGIEKYVSSESSTGDIQVISANCLRGPFVTGKWSWHTCLNDFNNHYSGHIKYHMSEGERLVEPTQLDDIEMETQLLDKGYCNSDITKARPASVQITIREKLSTS